MSKLSVYGRAGSRVSAWRRSPMINRPANVGRFEEETMTQAEKDLIDSMDYEELLRRWRFSPAGDPLFQGRSGEYFLVRMDALRRKVGDEGHVEASKRVGWTQDMRKAGRE